MDYCEDLLKSDDCEEWLTGLSTLSAIGTNEAVDRLILGYAHSLNENRKIVLSYVAKILTGKRFGVETILDGTIPDSIEETDESCSIDDLTMPPER